MWASGVGGLPTDASFTPLLKTPNHPEYPMGHATTGTTTTTSHRNHTRPPTHLAQHLSRRWMGDVSCTKLLTPLPCLPACLLVRPIPAGEAVTTVLRGLLGGDAVNVTFSSYMLPNATRSFTSLDAASKENM